MKFAVQFVVAAVVESLCLTASSQPLDSAVVDKAQTAMLARIDQAVKAFASQIKVEQSLITYCRGELALRTSLYPANGLVPFGVNYSQIRDMQALDTLIWNRESHETWFLKLCLANARTSMREAAR